MLVKLNVYPWELSSATKDCETSSTVLSSIAVDASETSSVALKVSPAGVGGSLDATLVEMEAGLKAAVAVAAVVEATVLSPPGTWDGFWRRRHIRATNPAATARTATVAPTAIQRNLSPLSSLSLFPPPVKYAQSSGAINSFERLVTNRLH